MPQSTCTVAACDRPIKNKKLGLCDPHYKRHWRYGDVQAHIPVPPKRNAPRPAEDFDDDTRRCQTCSDRLPLAYFHLDPSSPLGRKTSCRTCRAKVEADRYHADAPRVIARMSEYRRQNIEAVRARDMARYERDKDKRLALAIAASHARRARLREQKHERGITVPALRKRDGDACHYCKQTMVFGRFSAGQRPALMGTLEHVQPISRGGSHTWDNCVLACWRCNISRGNREWTPDGNQAEHQTATARS